MNVSNRGCIRRLSLKSLLANRTRNLVAVLAIALTAVLFTSLFTIALSINEGIQQNNFRQAGGWSHGTFKYLTEEQFEELKDDPAYQAWITGDNEANVCPGGESGVQMTARVLAAWAQPTEDTLLVTHGGVIAAIMAHLFPEAGKHRWQWQPQPFRGYELTFGDAGPQYREIP